MSQVDPSVMRRLRKILALTQSSEPGEAAAALHQAKKLMDAHGLSSADVEASEIETSEVRLSGATVSGWESPLLNVICQSLDVGVMICAAPPARGLRRKNAVVVFVGHGANAVVAEYAFARLRALLKKNLEDLLRRALVGTPFEGRRPTLGVVTPAARQAYALGWCAAVSSKVGALGASEPSPSIARYIEARTGGEAAEVKRASTKNRTQAQIFGSAGYRDGASVELHKAVHGAQSQAMLACPAESDFDQFQQKDDECSKI